MNRTLVVAVLFGLVAAVAAVDEGNSTEAEETKGGQKAAIDKFSQEVKERVNESFEIVKEFFEEILSEPSSGESGTEDSGHVVSKRRDLSKRSWLKKLAKAFAAAYLFGKRDADSEVLDVSAERRDLDKRGWLKPKLGRRDSDVETEEDVASEKRDLDKRGFFSKAAKLALAGWLVGKRDADLQTEDDVSSEKRDLDKRGWLKPKLGRRDADLETEEDVASEKRDLDKRGFFSKAAKLALAAWVVGKRDADLQTEEDVASEKRDLDKRGFFSKAAKLALAAWVVGKRDADLQTEVRGDDYFQRKLEKVEDALDNLKFFVTSLKED